MRENQYPRREEENLKTNSQTVNKLVILKVTQKATISLKKRKMSTMMKKTKNTTSKRTKVKRNSNMMKTMVTAMMSLKQGMV